MLYVWISVCIYVCVHGCIYVCLCMYVCLHACRYVCLCVCVCLKVLSYNLSTASLSHTTLNNHLHPTSIPPPYHFYKIFKALSLPPQTHHQPPFTFPSSSPTPLVTIFTNLPTTPYHTLSTLTHYLKTPHFP